MTETSKSRVDKLQEQMAKLEDKLKRARARESERERKADNKRKYLLGAMLHAWMKEDDGIKRKADVRIDAFLTRASDRRYFGLTGGKSDSSEIEDTKKDKEDAGKDKDAAA